MKMLLQKEDLNILDALKLIEATVVNLKEIGENSKAMDNEVESATEYAKQFGINPLADFKAMKSWNRMRLLPRGLDEHPESAVVIGFQKYYRKEMCIVLDCLIFEYDVNLKVCLQKVGPLAEVLQLPLNEPTVENIEHLCSLFPPIERIEKDFLFSELDVLRSLDEAQQFSSAYEAGKFVQDNKMLFPLVGRCYRLLFTDLVSVAKDERVFRKLMFVKSCIRSTMNGKRLNDIILLATGKDFSDAINLDEIIKNWSRDATF